jgi:hypothetical protein
VSPIRSDALPVLTARGFVRAASAWKALLLLLAVNALLALALSGPAASSLHQALDSLPNAGTLVKAGETTFPEHLLRSHPDLFGDPRAWARLAEGEGDLSEAARGFGGSLLFLGLLNAIVASIFAGGLAARFVDGSPSDLGGFLSGAARVAPSSLCLSLVSAAGIGGAWWGLFLAPGKLYAATALTFEWEAVGLALLRLSAFLVAAGLVRMTVLAARAALADSGRQSPLLALATGAGRVLAHPARALSLEVSFGLLGFGPLVLWGLLGPVWDGADLRVLALVVFLQQLLVLWRISVRASHLGAVGAWMKRAPGRTSDKTQEKPAV